MSRDTLTRVVTGIVFLTVLVVAVGRSRGISMKPIEARAQAPEDAVYRMMDAARSGDVAAYTGCYSGHMRELLQQAATEQGLVEFSQYLKTSNAAIQGVALSPPDALSDGQVKMRVEYVYKDRNEVQYVYLMKQGSVWLITKVDGTERGKTLVPFGSSVTE